VRVVVPVTPSVLAASVELPKVTSRVVLAQWQLVTSNDLERRFEEPVSAPVRVVVPSSHPVCACKCRVAQTVSRVPLRAVAPGLQ
jgi:hypothetical protein